MPFELARVPVADVTIPAGTVVRAQEVTEPVRFQLLAPAVIAAGADPPRVVAVVENSKTHTQLVDARGLADLELPRRRRALPRRRVGASVDLAREDAERADSRSARIGPSGSPGAGPRDRPERTIGIAFFAPRCSAGPRGDPSWLGPAERGENHGSFGWPEMARRAPRRRRGPPRADVPAARAARHGALSPGEGAHGAEFLRHARESYDGPLPRYVEDELRGYLRYGPLPRYVEDELRGYLRCGDFSRGSIHLRCRACAHDLLVAFPCKSRALCPSCAGRRMAAQAAHMVDRVLPAVPLRQYVLSFPLELSRLAAAKPDVPSAEPLVAPPPGARWELVLSTEDPRYGGAGTPGAAPGDASSGEALPVPGRCALVLRGTPRDAR